VPVTATNPQQFADRARQLADRAPAGSLDRKAALCVAARKALGDIGQADVRGRAAELLAELRDGCTP
jgi:hypothetical protein